jgi:hypothetical protein
LYTRWPNPISRNSPAFARCTYSPTRAFEPISFSIRSTRSFAPPWSGPYSAAAADDTATYGSAWELPTVRIVVVLQFCSWSMCRMKRTSSAFSRMGSGSYFGSEILYIMLRKFPAKLRSLSG